MEARKRPLGARYYRLPLFLRQPDGAERGIKVLEGAEAEEAHAAAMGRMPAWGTLHIDWSRVSVLEHHDLNPTDDTDAQIARDVISRHVHDDAVVTLLLSADGITAQLPLRELTPHLGTVLSGGDVWLHSPDDERLLECLSEGCLTVIDTSVTQAS